MLLDQIDQYKIDIATIQEIRWTGQGIQEKKRHTIFYSCDERVHEFGTGFIIRGRYRQLVIGFKAISTRVCLIRLRGKFYNYTILSVHAPTEAAEEDVKDAFYELLERTLDSCPRYDMMRDHSR